MFVQIWRAFHQPSGQFFRLPVSGWSNQYIHCLSGLFNLSICPLHPVPSPPREPDRWADQSTDAGLATRHLHPSSSISPFLLLIMTLTLLHHAGAGGRESGTDVYEHTRAISAISACKMPLCSRASAAGWMWLVRTIAIVHQLIASAWV